MKKQMVKDGVRVVTEDGVGTITESIRKGGEGYPSTHVPVRLDGSSVARDVYRIRNLRMV